MKAIIEYGGLDLTLYNINRKAKETIYMYNKRQHIAKLQMQQDLWLFAKILNAIYLAVDEADLRYLLSVVYYDLSKVTKEELNQRNLNYTFGNHSNDVDEEMEYMEVWQEMNERRIIYVEI